MIEPNPTNNQALSRLREVLDAHSDKRICVLGTTCTGKSTLASQIPGARDQDDEVFPKLSPQEVEFVCRIPWTPEIGEAMIRFVRERVQSTAGRPLFGTVVVDCDLIVLLKISDELLQQRCEERGVEFADARNMQSQIEAEAALSGIRVIEIQV